VNDETPHQAPPDVAEQTFELAQAPVVPASSGYADQLETVYRQVEDILRERAELATQRRQLQFDVQAMRERETEAKIQQLKIERCYRQLLNVLIDVTTELRTTTDIKAPDDVGEDTSQEHRDSLAVLAKTVAAALQRLDELFSAQGISVHQAEPGKPIDLVRFEVASVAEGNHCAPGIVVRPHRSAYLIKDTSIFPSGLVRKGSAIVTGQREPTSETTAPEAEHLPAE